MTVILARSITFVLIIFVFYIIPAHGSAPVHGAKAAGMNTAFTGVADDPTAILHNPAGITQLEGTRLYGGGSVVIPASSYQSTTGESVDTRFQVFFVPHFFITHQLPENGMTVGLGVYSPFGIGGRKWPSDGPTRYISIESAIGTVALNPTLAVTMCSSLSLAIGIDYMLARNYADNAIDQSAVGAADAHMKIDADGDGWGYNLGLLYQPDNAWQIGFAYRSGVNVDLQGSLKLKGIAPVLQGPFGGSNFKTSVSSKTKLPELIDIGIAYRPTSRWVIDVDVERDGWSSFQRTQLDLATEVPAAGLMDLSVPQDWHDIWAYKIGADFQVNNHLSVRAGYAFLNNPVPEPTLNPANPEADQSDFSFGLGWHEGLWTIDGFYNLGIYKTRHVNNTILSGRYDSRAHYLGVSVGHRI